MALSETERDGDKGFYEPGELGDPAVIAEIQREIALLDAEDPTALNGYVMQLEHRGVLTRDSDQPDDVFGGDHLKVAGDVPQLTDALDELRQDVVDASGRQFWERLHQAEVDETGTERTVGDALAHAVADAYVSGEIDLITQRPAGPEAAAAQVQPKLEGVGSLEAAKGTYIGDYLQQLPEAEVRTYYRSLSEMMPDLQAQRQSRAEAAEAQRAMDAAAKVKDEADRGELAAAATPEGRARNFVEQTYPELWNEYVARTQEFNLSPDDLTEIETSFNAAAIQLLENQNQRIIETSLADQTALAERARRQLADLD